MAWRGEGYSKPRKKSKKGAAEEKSEAEQAQEKKVQRMWTGTASHVLPTTSKDAIYLKRRGFKMSVDDVAGKRFKMHVDDVAGNMSLTLRTGIGFASMALSMATGSDIPIFAVFFAQLLKADPSKLMQVMIDKGDPARQGPTLSCLPSPPWPG
jgi:hypothetical protein